MSLINSAYMVGDKIKYKKRDEYFCVNNIVTIETGYITSIDARVSIEKDGSPDEWLRYKLRADSPHKGKIDYTNDLAIIGYAE